MFMEIAVSSLGIAIVLFVGFLVVAQVRTAMVPPDISYNNSCYGFFTNTSGVGLNAHCREVYGSTASTCYPIYDNTSTSILCDSEGVVDGWNSLSTVAYAGFGLIAVGLITLAAFGLIQVFTN